MRISKFTPEGYIIKEIVPLNILHDIQRIDRIRDGKELWGRFTEYLKKRLIGKVCSFPVLGKNKDGGNEIHGAGHWKIVKIYLDENQKVHMVADNDYDVILHIGSGVTNVIYYEDKPDPVSPWDPYGEEEWEYESVVNESKKDLYVGDDVEIIHGYVDRYNSRVGVITDFRNNRTQFKVNLNPNNDRYWQVDGIWFERGNLKKVDKIRKTKKEIRRLKQLYLKTKDVDPYGEEDWENESKINESYLSIDSLYVKVDSKEKYHELINFLKKNWFVWGGGGEELERWFPSWYHDGTYRGYLCPHYNVGIGIDNDGKRIYQSRTADNDVTVTVDEFIDNFKDIENYVKDRPNLLKIKRDELNKLHLHHDPYGEEDWLEENKINEDKGDFFKVGEILIYKGKNYKDKVGAEVMITRQQRDAETVHYRFLDDPEWNDHPCDVRYLSRKKEEKEEAGKVRWYKKGKLYNESMITSFHAFRNL